MKSDFHGNAFAPAQVRHDYMEKIAETTEQDVAIRLGCIEIRCVRACVHAYLYANGQIGSSHSYAFLTNYALRDLLLHMTQSSRNVSIDSQFAISTTCLPPRVLQTLLQGHAAGGSGQEIQHGVPGEGGRAQALPASLHHGQPQGRYRQGTAAFLVALFTYRLYDLNSPLTARAVWPGFSGFGVGDSGFELN